ncbi:hypothetical protein COLO4_25361 [Corchorus olitorius]|uniref:Uncharacterized protein n=1 Tax=Corchorus olitorius TaxID=93759 RepID=A0A1R3I3B3_9ROSI|nr:hypothetical protein COLO4_25361 [Corchorus olitorius]
MPAPMMMTGERDEEFIKKRGKKLERKSFKAMIQSSHKS